MGRKALSVIVLFMLLFVAMLTSVINVTPSITSAASSASPPAIEWSQTYSEVDVVENAFSVQQTSDGGYILAGVTFTQPSGNWESTI